MFRSIPTCRKNAFRNRWVTRNSNRSFLLKIPAEIRIKIWYYALQASHEEAGTAWIAPFSPVIVEVLSPSERLYVETSSNIDSVYWGTVLMSSLLLVNQQVHDEVEDVLYKRFMFHLHQLSVGMKIPRTRLLSEHTISLIQSVYTGILLSFSTSKLAITNWTAKVHLVGLSYRLPRLQRLFLRIDFEEEFGPMYPCLETADMIIEFLKAMQHAVKVSFQDPSPAHEGLSSVINECRRRLGNSKDLGLAQ
ncbi:hypothetical protein AOQ84DRAFT_360097 [Glonium stellatum]|uniref:Uncharacterized protein n=1 Tax=Glonium stellatum TaxID=574774 RepID=A0A8E2JXB6_9PEZI|nr:hypothetical protein AOQ84DRAFT_360097 [Glonium stellatum]